MRFAVVQVINLLVPLLVAGACIMGIFAWWSIGKYHIPVNGMVAFLTTALPPVNFILYKFIMNQSYKKPTRGGRQQQQQQQRLNISPRAALASILLYSLDVVMLMLSTHYLTEPTQGCLLKDRWMGYWKNKSNEINDIQNGLNCCGFVSQADMSLPSIPKDKKGKRCPQILNTSAHCLPLWRDKMRTNVGMLLAVSALVILFNLITLLVVLSNSPKVNKLLFYPFNGPGDYRTFMQEDEHQGNGRQQEQQPESGRIEAYNEEEDGDEDDHHRNVSGDDPHRKRIAAYAESDPERGESQRLLEHA